MFKKYTEMCKTYRVQYSAFTLKQRIKSVGVSPMAKDYFTSKYMP